MDLQPNHFPGKRRTSANTKKEKGDGNVGKSPSEPTRFTTVASRHRQNRVFGTVRSTNAIVGRPAQESSQVFKQLKPSGTSKRLTAKVVSKTEPRKASTVTGVSREDAKDAVRRPKPDTKISMRVRFPEQQQRQPEKAWSSKGVPEAGPRTPMSAIKPTVVLGTPYHSAVSCSKCRFDRLESAPYWLTQIKLAESVGKHFVSAAFFRLALECNAEPIRSLRSELKRYMARHSSLHILAAWKEVSSDYGLLNQEFGLGVIGFDAGVASVVVKQDPPSLMQQVVREDRDGCLRCESGVILQPELSKEDSTWNLDSSFAEPNSDVGENQSAIVIGVRAKEGVRTPTMSASEERLMKDGADDSNAVYHFELNNDIGEKTSAVVIGDGINESVSKPTVDVSKENMMKESADKNNAVCHSGNADSSMVTTPGNAKSDKGSSLSPNDSSSVRKEVQPCKSADGSKARPGRSQAASGLCREGTGKSKDEAKRNQRFEEGAGRNQNRRLKGASYVDENSIKTTGEIHNAALLGSCDDSRLLL